MQARLFGDRQRPDRRARAQGDVRHRRPRRRAGRALTQVTRAVIGTAGHVDHGKTTLVRELTGIDTDRLPEEKARGISIELGFAWLDLPTASGAASQAGRVAFVDVPGHERFVRQMIAGAAGVDAVLMVIAADEGVMPQTREHLDVCALLGVEFGAVVLTKADLIDDEWLALVRDDVTAAVRGTFLEGRPMVAFAAGDEARRAAVEALVSQLAAEVTVRRARPERRARVDDRPFAMPVDRVFTSPGFGTIVTGTTQCGRLAVGDEVVFYPGALRTRVRGLEAHGERVEVVTAGMRAAVNVPDLEAASLPRSGLLVGLQSGRAAFVPASMIDVTFAPVARLPAPIEDGEKGLVHVGTSRVEATLALLDDGLAQLRLAEPTAFVPGAGYVFRGFRTWAGRPDLGLTLGGGRALAPSPHRHRRRAECAAHVRALTGPIDAGLIAWLEAHGEAGVDRAALHGALPWARAAIDKAVTGAIKSSTCVASGATIVARAALGSLERALLTTLDALHREHPTRPGVRADELRTRVRPDASSELVDQVVVRLVSARELVRPTPDLLARADFVQTVVADDALREALLARFVEADLSPPRLADLATGQTHPLAGHASEALLAAAAADLVAEQRLVRVAPDLLFAASVLATFEARVRAYFASHDRMDAQALKELAGASRKYAIPLGEWLDRARVTVRMGDQRRLRG